MQMQMTPRLQVSLHWIGVLLTACALFGCASRPQVVDHAFGFDTNSDSPDVYVLDYRYGDSELSMARNSDDIREKGRSLQAANIMGPMKRGDFLYVKWRIKSTDQIFEEAVDLRYRLPRDITDHRVYFIVRGPQLYVYLISPERRPPDMPGNGPRVYSHLKTTTIYPDQPKQ